MVIIFAASIYVCHIDSLDLDTFLVLLNWRDSLSSCSWVNWKCKNSLIGRALGRLFLGLLMITKLGIQTKWLPTTLNVLADNISCLHLDEGGKYDYITSTY